MLSIMGQIAKKVGVSTATVSNALRGTGRVSEKIRLKVKKVAEDLDYRPHPTISKACSLARKSHPVSYRETLAFITEYPMDAKCYYQKHIHIGAHATARDMGYHLEPFLATGKRSEQMQLSRMLQARGIRGLVILPRVSHTHPRLYFDWDHFAAVEIYRTLWNPTNLHRVALEDYNKFMEAMHVLKKVGYRRVGMAIEPRQNYHQRGICHAAFLLLQSKQKASQRIPPLLSYGPWNQNTLKKWLNQYKPDVLYIHENREIYLWLKNLGYRISEDISLFCVNVQNEETSGLRRDYAGIGKAAVEMTSLLLGNNMLGLSGNPRLWMVDELWQAGKTLSRPISHLVSQEGFLIK